MGRDGTCFGGWVVPLTSAASVIADGGRPEVAELVVGSGTVEMIRWSSPELLESLERSFDGRSGVLFLWVDCRSPEVGRAVYCSLDQVEDVGDLLGVRRVFLDG